MAVSSMTEDDSTRLSAGRRLPHPLALAWFALFALLLAAVGFVALFGKASDGGPIARLDLAAAQAPAAKPAKHPAAKHAGKPRTPAELVRSGETSGAATAQVPAAERAGAEKGPEPTPPPKLVPEKITKPVYAGKALVADPALIEQTPGGPLPRIGDDGRTPMQAYAPPVPPAALKGRKKIAIVITGLGISARATQAALDGLPPGVTLAFAPYACDVQRWVSEARKRGHEVLLEVPMEPYDFPDSDPGPHTLRPMLSEDGNLERLKWSLSRFTGYAGVTNLLGGRFLANADAAGPVMSDLARRGLLFYDGGTTTRSAAEGIAARLQAPYVQSTLAIDSDPVGHGDRPAPVRTGGRAPV